MEWEKGSGLKSLEGTIHAKEIKDSGGTLFTNLSVSEIGPRLKAVRMARGKSQEVVAAQVGITPARLHRIENGVDFEEFTAALAEKIAFNLGLVKKLTLQEDEPVKTNGTAPRQPATKANGNWGGNRYTKHADMTDQEKRRYGVELKRRREDLGATKACIEKLSGLGSGMLSHIEEGRFLNKERLQHINHALNTYDPGKEAPRGYKAYAQRQKDRQNDIIINPPPVEEKAPPKETPKPINLEPTPFEMVSTREFRLKGQGFEMIASIGSKEWTFSIADGKEMLVFDSKAGDKCGFIEALKQMVKAIDGV